MAKKTVTLSIDEDLYKQFQIYCLKAKPRKIMSREIEQFMRDELQDEEIHREDS